MCKIAQKLKERDLILYELCEIFKWCGNMLYIMDGAPRGSKWECDVIVQYSNNLLARPELGQHFDKICSDSLCESKLDGMKK